MQTFSFDVSGKIDGIGHAKVTLLLGIATVTGDPARVTAVQIEAAIARLGHAATLRPAGHAQRARPWARTANSRCDAAGLRCRFRTERASAGLFQRTTS